MVPIDRSGGRSSRGPGVGGLGRCSRCRQTKGVLRSERGSRARDRGLTNLEVFDVSGIRGAPVTTDGTRMCELLVGLGPDVAVVWVLRLALDRGDHRDPRTDASVFELRVASGVEGPGSGVSCGSAVVRATHQAGVA